MLYFNVWHNLIIKIDFIYKINISNSYDVPYLNRIILKSRLRSSFNNSCNILRLITVFILLTGQKPVIKSAYFSDDKKYITYIIKKIIYKKLAFSLLTSIVLLAIPGLENQRSHKFNKKSSFLFVSNNLSVFPELKNYFNNFTQIKFMFDIHFSLLRFNVLNLLISSFQIA